MLVLGDMLIFRGVNFETDPFIHLAQGFRCLIQALKHDECQGPISPQPPDFRGSQKFCVSEVFADFIKTVFLCFQLYISSNAVNEENT